MTIREIAQLAGVSSATVSKVLNKKDQHISAETREKILKIAKECHYTPYGNILNTQNSRRFLVGVMLDARSGNDRVTSGIASALGRRGYSAIVASSTTAEDEYKNYMMLLSYQVDGILWNPVSAPSERQEKLLKESGIPYLTMDFRKEATAANVSFDYKEMGYELTQMLVKRRHRDIMCLLEIHGRRAELFFQGYRQCLFDNGIPFQENLLQKWTKEQPLSFDLTECTGVVCFDLQLARKISMLAQEQGLNVPIDLSVLAASKGEAKETEEDISVLGYPIRQLSQFAVNSLVDKIEGTGTEPVRFQMKHEYNHLKSLHTRNDSNSRRIVTVGPVCVETALELQSPTDYENPVAVSNTMRPGGGVSQIREISRSGMDGYLLGRIGRDQDGWYLYRYMKENRFHVDGIVMEGEYKTAHTYLLNELGGACQTLAADSDELYPSREELLKYRKLFRRGRFCLLYAQMGSQKLKDAVQFVLEQGVSSIVRCDSPKALADTAATVMDYLIIYQDKDIDNLLDHARSRIAEGVKAVVAVSTEGWFAMDAEGGYAKASDPVNRGRMLDTFTARLMARMVEGRGVIEAARFAAETCGK